MKIVVFSDVHGNSYVLKKFISQLEKIDYDYVIFGGDIFGYYYDQKQVLKMLQSINNLIWLRGNHDNYFLDLYDGKMNEEYLVNNYGSSYKSVKIRYSEDEINVLQRCSSKYEMEVDGKKIGIFHGTPVDSMEGRLYPNTTIDKNEENYYCMYDIVILGHTHCRMVRRLENTLIVNSGSIGQPRDGNQFGYAIVDVEQKDVQFIDIEYDCDELYKQIEENDCNLKKLKDVLERRKRV